MKKVTPKVGKKNIFIPKEEWKKKLLFVNKKKGGFKFGSEHRLLALRD
jgi:hypothetical protein